MAVRDYCRLHWDWYKDPVLRAIAHEAPCVMAVWPVLIAQAKEQSHATLNPSGQVSTTWAELARDACTDVGSVERAMALLVEGELATIEVGKLTLRTVTLQGFLDWNVARGSRADWQQAHRDRGASSRENVVESKAIVRAASGSYIEKGEREEDQAPLSMLPMEAPTTPIEKPDKISPKQVNDLFVAWRDLFDLNANTKLDDKRKRVIRRALADWSTQELWDCLRGFRYCREWPRDTLGKCNITVLFRDAAQIEAGIEKWQRQQSGSAAPNPATQDDLLTKAGY